MNDVSWSIELRRDLRQALRSLGKSPGFAVAAVLSLALGIGAGAAAFSVIDAVRFRALPFPHGDRLVVISEQPIESNGARGATCRGLCDVGYETFSQALRPRSFQSLDAIIGYTSGGKALSTRDEPLLVTGGVVSPETFQLLDARPLLGRTFVPDDDRLGAPPVTILSHALWTSQFGQDPNVVGTTVKLSDTRYTVIGVMPAGFEFEQGSQFWLPAVPTLDPSTRPSIRSLTVVGRLRPGATVAQLRAELSTIRPVAQPSPGGRAPAPQTRLDASPLRERYVGTTQSHDLIFASVVACVLLIACANVANLLLVRTLHQQRELAIRAALGAGMRRLTRFLLAQHLVLVAVGAIAGLLLAYWSLSTLESLSVLSSTRATGMEYRIDVRVVLFTLCLCVVIVAVLSGVPARLLSRLDVQHVLREGSPASGFGRGGRHAQQIFVVAQIASAVVLLSGAGLMARTVMRLARVDLGFEPRIVQGTPSYPHSWRVKETYVPVTTRVLAELQQLPGAASAALRATNRIGAPGVRGTLTLAGQSTPLSSTLAPNSVIAASEDYFSTMEIPIVRGRGFGAQDRETTLRVAIVNQWAAKRWWPGEDPIGKTFRIDSAPGEGVNVIVVGVVHDNRAARPSVLLAEDAPEVYRPYLQAPSAFPTFFVRPARGVSAASLLRPTRQALVRAVPDRPLFASIIAEQVDRQLGGVRTNALQILAFALVGLVLALTGIHGVLAYTVGRRTREIGIRGALGATRGSVRMMILRDAMTMTIAGLAIGLPVASASTRLIADFLHGTEAFDPLVYAAVSLGIVMIAVIGSWIPAHRAARVDPIIALRSQ